MQSGTKRVAVSIIVIVLSLGLVATYMPLFFTPPAEPQPPETAPVADRPPATSTPAEAAATSTAPAPERAPAPRPAPEPVPGGRPVDDLNRILHGGN